MGYGLRMQLDPAEKRSVWWKGALKSGLKETLRGLAIGFIAAAVLFGLAQFPALGGMLGPMVGVGVFKPALLMAFCGVISGVTGLFTGGGLEVGAYHQQKHNARDEAKLNELEGRTHTLEQRVAHSPAVRIILKDGPRQSAGFTAAEDARPQAASGLKV